MMAHHGKIVRKLRIYVLISFDDYDDADDTDDDDEEGDEDNQNLVSVSWRS